MEPVVRIRWINAGPICDGDSVALTAATQPSIEEIALGALPGFPKVAAHWPLIDFGSGPAQGADVTGPGVPATAERTEVPHSGDHGYKTTTARSRSCFSTARCSPGRETASR